VGRILRERHGNPIVVDIVDSHEPFQNQWKKRRQFFKKQNYRILYTTNEKYLRQGGEIWETVFNPFSSTHSSLSLNQCLDEELPKPLLENADLLKGKCLLPLIAKKK